MPLPNIVRNLKNAVRRAVQEPGSLREQVRDLPLYALNVAVKGVGNALLLTDRVREELRGVRDAGVGPLLSRLRGEPQTAPGEEGRVIPMKPEPEADVWARAARPQTPVRPEAAPEPVPAPAEPATPERPAAGTGPTPSGPPAAETGRPAAPATAAELPVPDYDKLSLPSLRARLRNLSAAEVRRLLDYEKSHAARADVIGMYERRIAKLEQTPKS